MSEIPKARINTQLPLEKAVVESTGAYCPMIMFTTGIVSGGKLQTSCQITFAAGKMVVDRDGVETWKTTGQTETIYIPDIDALEPDLADSLGKPFAQAYADMLAVVESLNSTRKLL